MGPQSMQDLVSQVPIPWIEPHFSHWRCHTKCLVGGAGKSLMGVFRGHGDTQTSFSTSVLPLRRGRLAGVFTSHRLRHRGDVCPSEQPPPSPCLLGMPLLHLCRELSSEYGSRPQTQLAGPGKAPGSILANQITVQDFCNLALDE